MELNEIKELIAVAEKVADSGKEIQIAIPDGVAIRISAKRQVLPVQGNVANQKTPPGPSVEDMIKTMYGGIVEDFKPYEPKTGTERNY